MRYANAHIDINEAGAYRDVQRGRTSCCVFV